MPSGSGSTGVDDDNGAVKSSTRMSERANESATAASALGEVDEKLMD